MKNSINANENDIIYKHDLSDVLNNECDLHVSFHGGNMSPIRIGQIFSRFNGLNDYCIPIF